MSRKERLPCLPLFVDDYEAATTHLTVEEDGAYSRLLRLAWRTPGCSLPNDEAWIARKIRMSAADFERVAKPVLEEFWTLNRGRLIQRRLKAEYDYVTGVRQARSEAGKRGGRSKALKTKESEGGFVSRLSEQNESTQPNPTQPKIQEKEPPVDPPSGKVLQFRPAPPVEAEPPKIEPKPKPARKAAAGAASRLPSDWTPGPEFIAYADEKGFDRAAIGRIAESFRDYWLSLPGSRGLKADWLATWRTWVRREAERNPPPEKQVEWC